MGRKRWLDSDAHAQLVGVLVASGLTAITFGVALSPGTLDLTVSQEEADEADLHAQASTLSELIFLNPQRGWKLADACSAAVAASAGPGSSDERSPALSLSVYDRDVLLQWAAPPKDGEQIVGYKVSRASPGSSWFQIAQLGVASSFEDKGAERPSGDQFSYHVAARFDPPGELPPYWGPNSNDVSVDFAYQDPSCDQHVYQPGASNVISYGGVQSMQGAQLAAVDDDRVDYEEAARFLNLPAGFAFHIHGRALGYRGDGQRDPYVEPAYIGHWECSANGCSAGTQVDIAGQKIQLGGQVTVCASAGEARQESYYLDQIAPQFNRGVRDTAYAEASGCDASNSGPSYAGISAHSEGDVYPDRPATLDALAKELACPGSGAQGGSVEAAAGSSSSSDRLETYNTILVGADVSSEVMTKEWVRRCLLAWVDAGGLLMVTGGTDTGAYWTQQLFGVKREDYARTQSHKNEDAPTDPALSNNEAMAAQCGQYVEHIPSTLADPDQLWRFTSDHAKDYCYPLVDQNDPSWFYFALSKPGAFGQGHVAFVSYELSDLREHAQAFCLDLFQLIRGPLEFDFGPPIPDQIPTGSATQIITYYVPPIRQSVEAIVTITIWKTGEDRPAFLTVPPPPTLFGDWPFFVPISTELSMEQTYTYIEDLYLYSNDTGPARIVPHNNKYVSGAFTLLVEVWTPDAVARKAWNEYDYRVWSYPDPGDTFNAFDVRNDGNDRGVWRVRINLTAEPGSAGSFEVKGVQPYTPGPLIPDKLPGCKDIPNGYGDNVPDPACEEWDRQRKKDPTAAPSPTVPTVPANPPGGAAPESGPNTQASNKLPKPEGKAGLS